MLTRLLGHKFFCLVVADGGVVAVEGERFVRSLFQVGLAVHLYGPDAPIRPGAVGENDLLAVKGKVVAAARLSADGIGGVFLDARFLGGDKAN